LRCSKEGRKAAVYKTVKIDYQILSNNKMLTETELIQKSQKGEEVPLEDGLFCLSGVDDVMHNWCLVELSNLQDGFHRYLDINLPKSGSDPSIGKVLFNYLLTKKKERYNGNFLLSDVILNLSLPQEGIGDCVGLTSLFSVMALREGMDVSILYSRNHVMPSIHDGRRSVAIDLTKDEGYDLVVDERFVHRNIKDLICGVLIRRALVHESVGNIEETIRDHAKSIALNPDFYLAYYSLAEVSMKCCDLASAETHYKISENSAQYRYVAQENLIRLYRLQDREDEALEYCNRAIKTFGGGANPYRYRAKIQFKRGNIIAGTKDYCTYFIKRHIMSSEII